MSDAVISSAPRTYPIPQAVQRAAELQRPSTNGAQVWSTKLLAGGGSATAELVEILSHVHDSEPFQRWATKVFKSAEYDRQHALTAALDQLEHDPARYTYLGICDSKDEDVVRSLVRVGADPIAWDIWTADRTWQPVAPDQVVSYKAYELASELVGFTADALAYADGILFRFVAPAARLPHDPVTTAGLIAAPKANDTDHYYAVVDSVDPSAVLDVVAVRPGPYVHLRQGGEWLPSPGTLERLTSIVPPPLVELDQDSLELVLAQMESAIDQAESDPNYVESIGHETDSLAGAEDIEPEAAAEEEKETVAASGVVLSGPEVVEVQRLIDQLDRDDTLQRLRFENAVASYRERVEDGDETAEQSLTAAMAVEAERRQWVSVEAARLSGQLYQLQLQQRRSTYESVVQASVTTRTRLAALETLQRRVPVAAMHVDRSRHYWLQGVGNVRLAWCSWNAGEGDT